MCSVPPNVRRHAECRLGTRPRYLEYNGHPPDRASKVVRGWGLGGLARVPGLPNATRQPTPYSVLMSPSRRGGLLGTVLGKLSVARTAQGVCGLQHGRQAIEASGWGESGGVLGLVLGDCVRGPPQPVRVWFWPLLQQSQSSCSPGMQLAARRRPKCRYLLAPLGLIVVAVPFLSMFRYVSGLAPGLSLRL